MTGNATPPLMMSGHSWHGRKGAVENAFRYGVDYVLIDPESDATGPALFDRNRGRFASVRDSDHGGAPGRGRGPVWLRDTMKEAGLPQPARIRLLTQPRLLGFVFNPVSFWLCEDDRGTLFCVVAEVTNTFGDRHSYLCYRDDLGPITKGAQLTTQKVMHVSPFQPVEGQYRFQFDIQPDRIGIRIDYSHNGGGVIATLTGPLAPLTNGRLLGAFVRRPYGSLRVLALIHWQALKLWWKGAGYRTRPAAPAQDVSR